jgi:transcriptional regulator with XRE-family HTH domain
MARTPKVRALGAALRAEREKRGLTLRDLAGLIQRNSGVLSRYENGERTPQPEHVSQVLTALAVTGKQYDAIMALAYDTEAPMWVAATLPAQRQQLAAFVDAEQNATHVTDVSPLLMPGLLQTNDYARAIMSGGGLSAEEVVTRLAIRIGRRDVITRPKPVQFTAFVGEAVLYQVIGGPATMLDQLRHLLAMARRPNVHIQIVPFGSGWHPGLEGHFIVIDPELPTAVVHIENRKSGLFLHEEKDVDLYLDAITMLRRAARNQSESMAIVAERLAGWERSL